MLNLFILFADRNADAHARAMEAVAQAFGSQAEVRAADNVDQVALSERQRGVEKTLLILIEPELTELELALKATHDDGSPRCAVVALSKGMQGSGLELIPPEEWNAALLARVFRAAVNQHQLVVENARLRGDLLTISRRVSHDMRTPLSGVFATAELVNEILKEHGEDGDDLTAPMYDSIHAVLRLIDRISFLGKATAESKSREEVDMGMVTWSARQPSEKLSLEKSVEWHEPEEWPAVQGVSAWLEVMWAQLLMNAVQAGPQGVRVELYWKDLGDAYEFGVLDNGPTIPEAKRSSLFQSFQSLHATHQARGFGLPITRRLAELQGGYCGYEALPEGGSRFYFVLPK